MSPAAISSRDSIVFCNDHRKQSQPNRIGHAMVIAACAIFGCVSLSPARASDRAIVNSPRMSGPSNEFQIARLVFDNGPHSNWGPGRPWWRIDWPDAEAHLTGGIRRYTTIDTARDSAHIALTDDAIFDYPWLFAQQVGRWNLSDLEASRLGEYLARGGFLVVDDFHGPREWAVFRQAMTRALPDLMVDDLEPHDPLLDILYEVDQRTQIPGRRHVAGLDANGDAYVQMPFAPPRWRGIRDENGRLLVAINFNMDMGDSWEHADDPGYPMAMTSLGYRFGINYVLYAMTH